MTTRALDLIDEYRIWVDPIVYGSGKHYFADGGATTVLQLTDSHTALRVGSCSPTARKTDETIWQRSKQLTWVCTPRRVTTSLPPTRATRPEARPAA